MVSRIARARLPDDGHASRPWAPRPGHSLGHVSLTAAIRSGPTRRLVVARICRFVLAPIASTIAPRDSSPHARDRHPTASIERSPTSSCRRCSLARSPHDDRHSLPGHPRTPRVRGARLTRADVQERGRQSDKPRRAAIARRRGGQTPLEVLVRSSKRGRSDRSPCTPRLTMHCDAGTPPARLHLPTRCSSACRPGGPPLQRRSVRALSATSSGSTPTPPACARIALLRTRFDIRSAPCSPNAASRSKSFARSRATSTSVPPDLRRCDGRA